MYWYSQNRVELLEEPILTTVAEIITPGQTGRVNLQGTTWVARFYEHETEAKLPDQQVYIVGREGNTLLVKSSSLSDDTKQE